LVVRNKVAALRAWYLGSAGVAARLSPDSIYGFPLTVRESSLPRPSGNRLAGKGALSNFANAQRTFFFGQEPAKQATHTSSALFGCSASLSAFRPRQQKESVQVS
jgi:hypothetical protein